ncbi:zinc-binding dehydrogenase [Haloactinomyces albus]|uniref:NADPH:quinone reductase-like Zn-dependent oxidoreductase n=1 Tax=Haloactinomyces albus TaxID=1352928 RepID=A0AAE3ZG66_9ACTN|nr:zinc-binding dehydrogenase [Haloactinomyces albus]MDR7302414.1 NADPH:quinone reductase-like Zn-dependent oxidoreductase [Haloactinomyces albus]
MTAAVLRGHGGPDMLDVRTDWPVPVAGAGEVLVRVTAAAMNNTDIWTREGAYGLPGDPDALAGWRGSISFPRTQGGDIAGVVAEVGTGVPAELVNRRVLVDPALYAHDGDDAPPAGLLGSEADGGFAGYIAVDSDRVHDMTDSPLSDQELACLPIAYGTAMGMLERAGIESGETVLVTGASGGVGLALVQLASARGATVVALTSGSKQEAVRTAGATSALSRDADDLTDEVTAAAGGHLDAVADVAGGPLVEKLVPLLRDNGRWVIAGAVAGPVVNFDLRRLYLHNLRLIGSSMHTRAHFRRLAHIAASGTVRPRVAAQYSLTDIHRAQQAFREHQHVGKIVLTV